MKGMMSKYGYRLLGEGEVIQEGDEYLGLGELWHKVNMILQGSVGKFDIIRRPITLSWLRKELKRLEEE